MGLPAILLYNNPMAVWDDLFFKKLISPNTQKASVALETATFIKFAFLNQKIK